MMDMSTYTTPIQQQDPVRPTLADLQRAQVQALREGDRKRAAMYAVLAYRRVGAAHRDALSQVRVTT
jgi:hypothetical protein